MKYSTSRKFEAYQSLVGRGVVAVVATYTKCVRQYRQKLPSDTIEFLMWLAGAYAKVKKTVYERYGGMGVLAN